MASRVMFRDAAAATDKARDKPRGNRDRGVRVAAVHGSRWAQPKSAGEPFNSGVVSLCVEDSRLNCSAMRAEERASDVPPSGFGGGLEFPSLVVLLEVFPRHVWPILTVTPAFIHPTRA